MKKTKIIILILLTFSFSCNSDKGNANKSIKSANNIDKKIDSEEKELKKKEISEYYAYVDKLRVRKVPGLQRNAEIVDVIDEGEKVIFLNEISEETYEVKLRGRDMIAPFYKVETKKGEIGWIFAGALSSFPVNVEHYRVAIFFDDTRNTSDWSYYASNAMNDLLGTGVESIYVTDDFDEVEIRNYRGDIIGVENISRIVKKNGIGVVCVEKGRSQKFVDYSPDMYYYILDMFDLLGVCR